jgi:hypothetical protein
MNIGKNISKDVCMEIYHSTLVKTHSLLNSKPIFIMRRIIQLYVWDRTAFSTFKRKEI